MTLKARTVVNDKKKLKKTTFLKIKTKDKIIPNELVVNPQQLKVIHQMRRYLKPQPFIIFLFPPPTIPEIHTLQEYDIIPLCV